MVYFCVFAEFSQRLISCWPLPEESNESLRLRIVAEIGRREIIDQRDESPSVSHSKSKDERSASRTMKIAMKFTEDIWAETARDKRKNKQKRRIPGCNGNVNLFNWAKKKDKSLKEKMGSKQSVTLSPDESQEVANRTGFSIAQVNKLYHRYFVELIQKIKDQI